MTLVLPLRLVSASNVIHTRPLISLSSKVKSYWTDYGKRNGSKLWFYWPVCILTRNHITKHVRREQVLQPIIVTPTRCISTGIRGSERMDSLGYCYIIILCDNASLLPGVSSYIPDIFVPETLPNFTPQLMKHPVDGLQLKKLILVTDGL